MRMKILAAVIVYEQETELLRRSLDSYAPYVDKVVLWNNNPEVSMSCYVELASDYTNIDLLSATENQGIAYPLNQIWRKYEKDGYALFMSMDQDSIFADFPSYLAQAKSILQEDSCILSPNANSYLVASEGEKMTQVKSAITSGMMMRYELLAELGGYREDFFVDAIDIDFCIRARKCGHTIYCVNDSLLIQRYGTPISFELFGKRYTISRYSDWRLHDIFQNHIILYRQYGDCGILCRQLNRYFKTYVIAILFGGKHKMRQLAAIARGIKDGYQYEL